MTRLRKMMLEELQRRNYSAITTRNYLRVVADFAKYFGKSLDKLGPNELRTYQAYLLRERELTPGTMVTWRLPGDVAIPDGTKSVSTEVPGEATAHARGIREER